MTHRSFFFITLVCLAITACSTTNSNRQSSNNCNCPQCNCSQAVQPVVTNKCVYRNGQNSCAVPPVLPQLNCQDFENVQNVSKTTNIMIMPASNGLFRQVKSTNYFNNQTQEFCRVEVVIEGLTQQSMMSNLNIPASIMSILSALDPQSFPPQPVQSPANVAIMPGSQPQPQNSRGQRVQLPPNGQQQNVNGSGLQQPGQRGQNGRDSVPQQVNGDQDTEVEPEEDASSEEEEEEADHGPSVPA